MVVTNNVHLFHIYKAAFLLCNKNKCADLPASLPPTHARQRMHHIHAGQLQAPSATQGHKSEASKNAMAKKIARFTCKCMQPVNAIQERVSGNRDGTGANVYLTVMSGVVSSWKEQARIFTLRKQWHTGWNVIAPIVVTKTMRVGISHLLCFYVMLHQILFDYHFWMYPKQQTITSPGGCCGYGHFDIWTEEDGFKTSNILISGWPLYLFRHSHPVSN